MTICSNQDGCNRTQRHGRGEDNSTFIATFFSFIYLFLFLSMHFFLSFLSLFLFFSDKKHRLHQRADLTWIQVPRELCYYVKVGSKWETVLGHWEYRRNKAGKYDEVPLSCCITSPCPSVAAYK